MENSLKKHIDFYESFVDKVDQGHRESKQCRDYVNNIQWTAEEEETLRRRKQPVITDNRIKRKTDYFLGIERQTRTDPKAFPRTPMHEKDADAVTDALRYVCDNSDWDIERSEGFDNLIVEGIEGYSIPVKQLPNGQMEIQPKRIPWDRIIYDPHSTDRFFRNSKKKGVVIWMDQDDAENMFPGKEDIIEASISPSDDEDDVLDDRPRKVVWNDRQRKRIKVIQLYYLEKGTWMHCIFTKMGYLIDPEKSPYLDEYEQPECPIELGSAYVDRDNDRFGLVRDMISLQDMVNKMQSKFMHFMNSNQTWGNEKGPNANEAKKQAKMPDGHFAIQGQGKFGEDFGIIPTDNKAGQTFTILQQALQSLSEIGGSSIVDDQDSGRAKEITQQNKMIELGPVLDTHRQVSRRVYKQIWNRIRQFWNEEKWIRTTDNENNLKFVKLNEQVSYAQALQEEYGEIPQVALGHPGLNQIREVRNNVAEIDVDIIIEDAPDVINVQQEQFEVIARLAEVYGPQEVPFEEVLRLSQLRGKDSFLERTKGNEQQRAQQAQAAQQQQQEAQDLQKQEFISQIEERMSKVELNQAKTQETLQSAGLKAQETEAKDLENELTVMGAEAAVR